MAHLSTKRPRIAQTPMLVLLVTGLIATGCQATKMTLWSWKMPGIGTRGEVLSVTKRATYLDATLKVESQEYRFLFPGRYECTQVIQTGASIEYASFRHLPAVRSSEGSCDPIGILSLKVWVERHRAQMTPARSGHDVSFDVFYRDDEVSLARGEFEFARPVAFRHRRGAGRETSLSLEKNINVIAVIPNQPECEKQLTEGKARAEFHPEQGDPYQLVSGADVCPVLGFARGFQAEKPVGAGRFD